MKKSLEIIPWKLADTYGEDSGKYILTTCDGEHELTGVVYDTAAEAEAAAITIETIARARFGVETLLAKGWDSLDFHDVSIVSIRTAVEAAYEAGFKARKS